jgi:hypothetical protein
MTYDRRRQAEQGTSIAMAVLALTIVAFIMLYVGTQALNSMYTARKKSDNSVGMAAGDSAIEKVRVALHAGLASEVNDFMLTEADLKLLTSKQKEITVIKNSAAPGYSSMVPVLLSDPATQYTVREPGSDTIGYWQIFNVVRPRYSPAAAHDVVYYIRAWATAATSDQITTKPRVFRVEYRPGWFSDYQSVTDAPFIIEDNANVTINGPIHSNGYSVVDWLATDSGGTIRRGIYFKDPPTCTTNARFSTSQNRDIIVPGASCANAMKAKRQDARQISLLGVEDTYARINRYCPNGKGLVYCFSGGAPYNVTLGTNAVNVNGTTYPLRWRDDNGALVLLLDGDVVLTGKLSTTDPSKVGRVTIATRRRTVAERQPDVHVRGCSGCVVGSADPKRHTVAVITQGNVIFDTRNYPGAGCLSQINLASIAESGATTIPPEFVTISPPPFALNTLDCSKSMKFQGSFSSHGQFIPSIKWPDIRNPGKWLGPVGYSKPTFTYTRNLYTNPAPFFPLATPWGVTKAKDADDRCLVPSKAGDPTCE